MDLDELIPLAVQVAAFMEPLDREEEGELKSLMRCGLQVIVEIHGITGIVCWITELKDFGPERWEKVTVNIQEYLAMRDSAFRLNFRMSQEIFQVCQFDITSIITEKSSVFIILDASLFTHAVYFNCTCSSNVLLSFASF